MQSSVLSCVLRERVKRALSEGLLEWDGSEPSECLVKCGAGVLTSHLEETGLRKLEERDLITMLKPLLISLMDLDEERATQAIKHLLEWMNDRIDGELGEEVLSEGEECWAQWSGDGCWYRCRILEIEHKNERYRVEYEGYGNQESVHISAMRMDSRRVSKAPRISSSSLSKSAPKGTSIADGLRQSERGRSAMMSAAGMSEDRHLKKRVNTEMEAAEVTAEDEARLRELAGCSLAEFEEYAAEQADDDDDGGDPSESYESSEFSGKRHNYGYSRVIRPSMDECCMCGRMIPLTWHHLIPRTTHVKMRKKHGFSKEELNERGIWVCRACHSAIHGVFDEMTLAEHYHTLPLLLESEQIQKWVAYISKRTRKTFCKGDSRTLIRRSG